MSSQELAQAAAMQNEIGPTAITVVVMEKT
jgi:hypothetical protein